MSDFLTRMARLSLGEMPVVVPRVPSLFSSVDDAGLSETTQTNVLQVNKTEQANEGIRHPSSAPTVDEQMPQSAIPSGQSAKEPFGFDSFAGHIDMSRKVSQPLVVRQDKPAILGRHENHAARVTTSIASSTHEPQNESATAQSGTDDQKPPKGDNGHYSVDASSGQPVSVISQLTRPLLPDYKNPQTAVSQVMAGLTVADPTVAQKSTVHINIGRVEVRARSAAPPLLPRPVRAERENSLSLSEYLKRSGGRS